MKKLITNISLAIIAIITFSFSINAQSIEGSWVLYDMDFAIPENATDEEIEQFEMMKGFIQMAVEEMRGKVTIEFFDDNSYLSTTVEENDETTQETGMWKLEGDQLYMKSDQGDSEEEPITIELTSGEMRFVIEEEGQTMYMIFIPQ